MRDPKNLLTKCCESFAQKSNSTLKISRRGCGVKTNLKSKNIYYSGVKKIGVYVLTYYKLCYIYITYFRIRLFFGQSKVVHAHDVQIGISLGKLNFGAIQENVTSEKLCLDQ